ncbi:MAG: hypothetical protein ACE5MI_12285 [Acidimicrobiia bacterium]
MLGVGLRAAMRVAAVSEGQETSFTIGGTFFILLVGAAIGVIIGALYGGVRRWVPGAGLGKGAIFGFVLALLVGALLFGPSGSEARTIGSPLLNMLTFGGSIVLLGIGIEWMWPRIEKRPAMSRRAGAGEVSGAIVGIGAALVLTVFALARWMAETPDGFWLTLGLFVGFAAEGLLLGAVLGVFYGLVRRGGRWSRVVYPVALVVLWLVVVLTAGDDGMTGPDATEIVAIVALVLAGFGVASAWLTERLLRAAPVLVTSMPPIGG